MAEANTAGNTGGGGGGGNQSSSQSSTSSGGTRYFCHKCSQEIPHVSEDFTCPICKGGFIEEVQPNDEQQFADPGFRMGGTGGGGGIGPGDFIQQLLRGLSDPTGGAGSARVRFSTGSPTRGTTPYHRARSVDSGGGSPTGGGGGGRGHSHGHGHPQGQGHPAHQHQFSFVFSPPTHGQGGHGHRRTGTGGGGGTGTGADPMEAMLFSFLNDLITGLGGGAVAGAPVLHNLGDYAWGQEGLDAIVTQLMNQMENSGPPPLTTDKIDTLPDFKVTQAQLDKKLQCSVCWEDFNLDESVKRLECEHLFHLDCIVPWLKLHGTCPICRKDLTGQENSDASSPVPSARFEPENRTTDSPRRPPSASSAAHSGGHGHSHGHGNIGNFSNISRSNTAPSSATSPGLGYDSPQQHSNSVPSLFSQLFDPSFLSGVAAAGRHGQGQGGNNRTNNPRPSSRRGAGGRGGNNSRDDGGRPNNQDFDNMDMEFD